MGEEVIEFSGKHVTLERWGLDITGDIEWDEFSALGKKLMTVHDGIQFALGDWVNYGDARWGEKYKAALEKTPYSYDSLAQFAWVCRRFSPEIRRQICDQSQKFSYTILLRLARLSDDDALHMLELAEANKWPVSRVQDEVAERYPRPGTAEREREIDLDDQRSQTQVLDTPHYGTPKGPGFFLWFGMSELPLLRQIFPKHPGTLLIQKRLAEVEDA